MTTFEIDLKVSQAGVEHGICDGQANPFIGREWELAMKEAEDMGLEQEAAEEAAVLQKRRAALILDLHRLSNAGFNDAEQACGTHTAAGHFNRL